MILWELVKVFTLSLLAITGILLMAGIVAEASQQGLGPTQIVAIIPLLIPSTLPYTIPATTLFATCVVYGRLSADNEILAIKAAGVNILKVVWPGIVLGLVMSGITMGMYYRIIPYTHHLMRTMFLKNVEEVLYTMLRKEHRIEQSRLKYSLFVQRVVGRKLIDPIFKSRNEKGGFDGVARAREADLTVRKGDPNNAEAQTVVLVHMKSGVVWSEGGTLVFDERVEKVELPIAFGSDGPRRPRDMSWQEMRQHRRELVAREEATIAQSNLSTAQLLLAHAPKDLAKHQENLTEMRKYLRFDIQAIDAEMYMRPALAFGCLFFVLVGCPVGIWLSKNDYLSSFITCFLPIVFLYYPLLLCGSNLAKEGKFHPAVTVWAANAAMGLIALVLFRRLLRN
jgi:lipopolysaccharide export system permease protein